MKYGAINIGFTYDVDGLRTSKTIPNVGLEHKYYYVGNRLQYETLGGSSALWYFYDADGNPSGIRYKNGDSINDYYFVCNWRGDVIQIYNASGTLVGSYTYDAWGRVTENATSADTQNITETNPIRYRGYYYDTETRLYYLKSRYYDPAVKRFLNADSKNDSAVGLLEFNFFVYCGNNPINNMDPTGHGIFKKIFKYLKTNFLNTIRWAINSAKALNFKFGVGIGIGASGSSRGKVVKVGASAIVASTDYVYLENGRVDKGNVTRGEVGVDVEGIISASKEIGYEHLFSDPNCTCDNMTPLSKRYKCPASQSFNRSSGTIGFSIDAYFGIGVSVSMEIDIIAWDKADRTLHEDNRKLWEELLNDS